MEDAEEDASYYELLNIPKDASQDQIRKAYLRYSTVLHPDKQQDSSLREEAASYFVKIQEAHEVRTHFIHAALPCMLLIGRVMIHTPTLYTSTM